MAAGYIYIIQEGNDNAFYVGGSSVDTLQTGNYRRLTVKDVYAVDDVSDARDAAHDFLEGMAIYEEDGGKSGWFNGDYETIRVLVHEASIYFVPPEELPVLQHGAGYDATNAAGYIYIIQEGEHEVFKVGATTHKDVVNNRLKQIQPGNYRKLTFRYKYKVNNMSAAENAAHNELRALHIEGGGKEWFTGHYQDIEDGVHGAISEYLMEDRAECLLS